MFNFGIEGYRPTWGNGLADAMGSHAARLHSLVGRKLTSAWLVWDLDDEEWFADCPVLLDFAGEQIEINHQKFDRLSITWNSADPAQPVVWSTKDDFHLTWRNDTRTDLEALYGQPLQEVELLEWANHGDMANGTIAVSFTFERGHLCVFNALDENGLHLGSPDSRWRRHSVTR